MMTAAGMGGGEDVVRMVMRTAAVKVARMVVEAVVMMAEEAEEVEGTVLATG
jgi:hypothetical protein